MTGIDDIAAEREPFKQREYMRRLVASLGHDRSAIVTAYAMAERKGIVHRASTSTHTAPEAYALALWRDGVRKGWLHTGKPAGVEHDPR